MAVGIPLNTPSWSRHDVCAYCDIRKAESRAKAAMEFKTMSSRRTIRLMTRYTLRTALWMFRRRRGAQDAIPLLIRLPRQSLTAIFSNSGYPQPPQRRKRIIRASDRFQRIQRRPGGIKPAVIRNAGMRGPKVRKRQGSYSVNCR
jgi:hypothetical protein